MSFKDFYNKLTKSANCRHFEQQSDFLGLEMTITLRAYIYYLQYAAQLSKMNIQERKQYTFTFTDILDHDNKAVKYLDKYVAWLLKGGEQHGN